MIRAQFSGPTYGTILTEMMADEFNFLWTKIQNYIAEADADLIPVQGQLELHGRCRCDVLLFPLVAQCSDWCDCSCDTVARSVFGTQKCRDTLHQPAATPPPRLAPCLLQMRQESATGGSGERCNTLIWGGAKLYARHWVARLGSGLHTDVPLSCLHALVLYLSQI